MAKFLPNLPYAGVAGVGATGSGALAGSGSCPGLPLASGFLGSTGVSCYAGAPLPPLALGSREALGSGVGSGSGAFTGSGSGVGAPRGSAPPLALGSYFAAAAALGSSFSAPPLAALGSCLSAPPLAALGSY